MAPQRLLVERRRDAGLAPLVDQPERRFARREQQVLVAHDVGRAERRQAGLRGPGQLAGPRIRRSCSATLKPSSVSSSTFSRASASGPASPDASSTQYDLTSPRPTRPRSWCSCASPNRSASSTTITEASRTSIPTSITVVATRIRTSPAAKRSRFRWRSAAFIRPWTSATGTSGKRPAYSRSPSSAALRPALPSSTAGRTT